MKNKPPKKSIGSFFANTSNALLKNFLSDFGQQELQLKISREMAESLLVAAKDGRAVVLQVQNPMLDRIETYVGWIMNKSLNTDQLMIRLKDGDALKMIPINNILKVSIWGKEGLKSSIRRNL